MFYLVFDLWEFGFGRNGNYVIVEFLLFLSVFVMDRCGWVRLDNFYVYKKKLYYGVYGCLFFFLKMKKNLIGFFFVVFFMFFVFKV